MLRRTFLAAIAALSVIGRVKREKPIGPLIVTPDNPDGALKAELLEQYLNSVDPAVDPTVYVIRCVWNPGPLSVENCRFVPWKGVSL